MSEDGAHLRSFAALKDLDIALGRFAAEIAEVLGGVEPEIRGKLHLLEERRREQKHDRDHWQRAYDEAGDEQDDVGYIAHKLEEAEDELRRVRHWQRRTDECHERYLHDASALRELATARTPKARAFLMRKLAELQAYVAVGVAGAVGSSVASAAAAGASESLADYPLPEGFRWVFLSEINAEEFGGLSPQNDFRKTSYSEMRRGLDLLRTEVLPAIRKTPHAGIEYFRELDRQAARDYPDGVQRVYEVFFGRSGNEHIRVERKVGDPTFSVTNGRHRIKAAFDAGWMAVPAEVVEIK